MTIKKHPPVQIIQKVLFGNLFFPKLVAGRLWPGRDFLTKNYPFFRYLTAFCALWGAHMSMLLFPNVSPDMFKCPRGPHKDFSLSN